MENNTCELKLNLNINSNNKTSILEVSTQIDGKEIFIHKDSMFRGDINDITEILSNAVKLIEKDERFQ